MDYLWSAEADPTPLTPSIAQLLEIFLHPLIRAGLEADPVLGLRLKWHTQLEKLDNDIGELLEENLTVLCVSLNVLLELLVLDQCHIGW